MSKYQQETENDLLDEVENTPNQEPVVRNWAVGDPMNRTGEEAFTAESFYELADRVKGNFQCFATYLGYSGGFLQHVFDQDFSVRGWNGEGVPAYFDDFPVDFDSKNIELAYADCKRFIDTELLAQGIDKRHFVIYLSGGKGFHVHISAACFEGGSPMVDAARRFKLLAEQWAEEYSSLDVSIYKATSLIRLPGTKHHSSGLFKTEIPLELFTLEYINRRHEWASTAQESIRRPSQEVSPQLIKVPELQADQRSSSYPRHGDEQNSNQSKEQISWENFDPETWITERCQLLKAVQEDPSNGGKEGQGREKRRNAIGILLRAYPPGDPNPELELFIKKLFEHPYMNKGRKDDVLKWLKEYRETGEIKTPDSCLGLKCESAQKRLCRTISPLDWKIIHPALVPIPIEEARDLNKSTIQAILDTFDDGITVLNWPVGIGKTYELIEAVSNRSAKILLFSPTHELAVQTQRKFQEKGLETRHIASRDYLSRHKGFTCSLAKEVAIAQKNGYGSRPCQDCPRRHSREGGDTSPCDYFEQSRGVQKVPIVIGVHDHMTEQLLEQVKVWSRSLAVIDESPVQKLIIEIKPIRAYILRIIICSLDDHSKEAEKKRAGGLYAIANPRGLLGKAVGVIDAVEGLHDLDCLSLFSDVFTGQEVDLIRLAKIDCDDVVGTWKDFARATSISSGLAQESNLDEDSAYFAIPFPFKNAQRLAAAGKRYNPAESNYLPCAFPPIKTVILDATANQTVYNTALADFLTEGRPYSFIESKLVEQPYSHTIQVTNASNGASALDDEGKREELANIVRQLRKKHPGHSLLVTHKKHEEFWCDAFKDDWELDIAHFGGLKGLNAWENCTAEYIIGTPFVPDSALLELGRKFEIGIGPEDLEASEELRRVRLIARNGVAASTRRRTFRGLHFYTAASQMLSQGEVTQAVRLRLYNKPACGKQHLYIFSNVELKGMYADELLTLDELAAREGIQKGTKGEKETAFQGVEAWFGEQPIGKRFSSSRVQADADIRYIREWLRVAAANGWVEKRGEGRGTSYIKRSELQ